MKMILIGALLAAALFAGILLLLAIGRRIGARNLAREGEISQKGLGALEGAIFALLGLVLAFSFSGALARFDARRQLVVEEANAIGTAWLRVDLLPETAREPMRDLFRSYLESRIETYRKVPDMTAVEAELARSAELQGQIWELAVSTPPENGSPLGQMLLLPALNAMIDITTTRTEAARIHPPSVVFILLGVLALACALFAGYDMAVRRRLNPLHSLAFALVLSVTVYVIVDLEYPRVGLIQVTDSDQLLSDLRKSMD
jgi:hypothetical protein